MSNEYPIQVDRNVYPRPEYRYPDAKISTTYVDSVADFPPPQQAPGGVPNILLVLLDDIGFGWPSVFGGLVEMPTAERLAGNGLIYNQMHTTALCSPTRAALLTGRNHHTVHTGMIGELATGFPGYDGIMPKSCATIAELLHQNGYATGWWGKNHNVPDNETSDAGPFDNWPTNQGFDYFYGFLGGETDQFRPGLFRGTRPVEAPDTAENGYHLDRDLADDCIAWMRRQKAIAPDRPLFTYFTPGSAHAPHQPPLDWRGRNAGRFDMGWDEYRRQTWERQLAAGAGRHRAHGAARGDPAVGRRHRRGEAALRPVRRELRRLPLPHRPPGWSSRRCPRRDGRARQHPGDLHHWRQRIIGRGFTRRLAQRVPGVERLPARVRRFSAADRRDRPARNLTALPGRVGVGR
jgi:hypothetical protein